MEDNKVARTMLSGMLKQVEDLEITGEFEDAPGALSYLSKNNADILFLDVELPGMSGLEMLRVLKERPLTILVSAQPVYAIEAFELNVVDFLVKPFSLTMVLSAIDKTRELLNIKYLNITKKKQSLTS
ncbi:MAG: response regulator [Chitinophagaceae bacterium]|nr:response regulator [Chitinophagaceae bacterium]